MSECELQTESVDIHSLNKQGNEWGLCVYQTPAVLMVTDVEIAKSLGKALDEGRSVVLTWEPTTGQVVKCELG